MVVLGAFNSSQQGRMFLSEFCLGLEVFIRSGSKNQWKGLTEEVHKTSRGVDGNNGLCFELWSLTCWVDEFCPRSDWWPRWNTPGPHRPSSLFWWEMELGRWVRLVQKQIKIYCHQSRDWSAQTQTLISERGDQRWGGRNETTCFGKETHSGPDRDMISLFGRGIMRSPLPEWTLKRSQL